MPDPFRDWLSELDGLWPYPELWTHNSLEGEFHINTQTWTNRWMTHESFSCHTDRVGAMGELKSFTSRHKGIWSDKPHERVAVWHEVIGSAIAVDEDPDWYTINPLGLYFSKYLGLPHVVFTYIKGPAGQRLLSSGVTRYDHLTHVMLGPASCHVFLLDNNEIVTICDRPLTPLFISPELRAATAATVLGVIITDRRTPTGAADYRQSPTVSYAQVLRPNLHLRQPVYELIRQELTNDVLRDKVDRAWDKYGNKAVHYLKNDEGLLPDPLERVCADLLDKHTKRPWLHPSLQARLVCASAGVGILKNNLDYFISRADALAHGTQDEAAADQAKAHQQTAERRARSAALLNKILAPLAIGTLITLPYMMAASYYGMNVTDDVTATHGGFAKIVGPITGVLIVGVIGFSLYLWLRQKNVDADLEAQMSGRNSNPASASTLVTSRSTTMAARLRRAGQYVTDHKGRKYNRYKLRDMGRRLKAA